MSRGPQIQLWDGLFDTIFPRIMFSPLGCNLCRDSYIVVDIRDLGRKLKRWQRHFLRFLKSVLLIQFLAAISGKVLNSERRAWIWLIRRLPLNPVLLTGVDGG